MLIWFKIDEVIRRRRLHKHLALAQEKLATVREMNRQTADQIEATRDGFY